MEHLTEEQLAEWDRLHEEAISWGHRWTLVTVMIISAAITTLVLTGISLATVVLMVLGGIGLVAKLHYHRKHMALHMELEGDEE